MHLTSHFSLLIREEPLRRLQAIERLSKRDQLTLFRAIDAVLLARAK